MHKPSLLLWLIVALGILLRATDISFPDFATDEAQFALFASAAQPPAGMAIFSFAQAVFGTSILAARSVSVILGIATIFVIYLIALEISDRRTALIIAALASIFPAHIIFSRLAYLSAPLCFAWTLTVLMYLKAKKRATRNACPSESASGGRSGEQRANDIYTVGLFLAAVLSTFIKTQGILLPLLLLIGTIIGDFFRQKKHRLQLSIVNCQKRPRTECASALVRGSVSIVNCQLSIILALSLIPITLFVLTSPSIAATLFLYGGNMYGLSGFLDRIATLGKLWWHLLPIFLILFAFSLTKILFSLSHVLRQTSHVLHPKSNVRRPKSEVRSPNIPWPVWTLITIGILQGLVLGPGHEYYTTHLVYWSIPIGMMLSRWKPYWQNIAIAFVAIDTLFITGPRSIFLNNRTFHIFRDPGYWNEHADEINRHLAGTDEVIALGEPGHHVRWYLEPEVLVGKNMDLRNRNGIFLILDKEKWVEASEGEKIYEDEEILIVNKQPG